MMNEKTLSGRIALVTGATRGIGKAIAQQLHLLGAKVIATGTRVTSDVPKDYIYCPVDFSDKAALNTFVESIPSYSVDILVNNAGINSIDSFQSFDTAEFERIQQVNVHAPFLISKAVIPSMRKKSWGRIVNISSIFGKVSKAHRAPYSASKFALDGMTAALAAEVAAFGILANCVAPGFIETDLTRTVMGEKGMREIVSQIPLGRMGKVEEIAKFVSWLVSPENTYISGQNIAVDGGFTRV